MVREAFLLAAGMGTRLRPYTDNLPKPLVQVNGKTLLERNLDILQAVGIKKVVINAFYMKDKLKSFVENLSYDGLNIFISDENELLDTGGGLKNAWSFFETEKILTWNSDILIDPRVASDKENGLFPLLNSNFSDKQQALIRLLVSPSLEEENSLYTKLGFDNEMRLTKFLGISYRSKDEESKQESNYKFLGISVVSREIEDYFPQLGAIFSLTRDLFPLILKDRGPSCIVGSICNYYWNDVGTPERLQAASQHVEALFKG